MAGRTGVARPGSAVTRSSAHRRPCLFAHGEAFVLAVLGLPATAERVYREMLADPGLGVADLTRLLGITETEVREALDRLFELSLVRESADRPDALHVISPEVGLRHALAQQHAELAQR